tara:strand:+ start:233 stop:742 length:510 start_codon:yes stop_codon:yes gene_type:complete
MLGLGSSVNSEEGYAKGERYRERFNDHVQAYNPNTNPIGHDGWNYIGDFTTDTDFDNFTTSNIDALGRNSNGLRLVGDGTNGYAGIAFKTIPGVSYTLSVIVSPEGSNAGIVQIGTSATDTTFHNSGNITSAGPETATFTATGQSTWLTLFTKVNDKYVDYDNISVKEA